MKLPKNCFYAIVAEKQNSVEIIERSNSEDVIYRNLNKYKLFNYNIYIIDINDNLITKLTRN